jgi:guanosine-3',5'-bis(diphosphate) 3'-pyrophosphohydrolase
MATTGLDPATLFDAIHFASLKHHGQRREEDAAAPFISHPLEVARLLADVGGVADPTTLLAALLHDVLEDTATTPAELEGRYGAGVRRLVEDVTADRRLPPPDRRRAELEQAPALSLPARAIRLADTIATLRSLPQQWSPQEKQAYVDFAERMGAALRGANPPLDALFKQVLVRAREALRAPAPPRVSPQPRLAPPPGHLLRPEVGRELRRLQRLVSTAEELAGDLVDALDPDDTAGAGAPLAPSPPDRPPGARRFPDPTLAALVERGVGWVTIEILADHRALVQIEGGEEFQTGPVLAHLLRLITCADTPSEDGLEPFQSLATVAGRLGAVTGGTYAPHRITTYVHRLRSVIRLRGKVNPMLIDTCPRRGVRFRVRRRPS